MLTGIDVSNHQGDNGIDLASVLDYYDFCIVKATGGTYFVDAYCDGFVEKCKAAGKKWGFYHFANDGVYSSAYDEACFFVGNCSNYFGEGIPILDWEVDVPVSWVNEFVRTVHELTGVWCWVYGNPWRFGQGDVEQNCGRWVAAYPSWIVNPQPGFDPGDCPDCPGLVAAWQYASDGRCPAYSGNLDVNVFYGDETAWDAYAAGDNAETPSTVQQPIQVEPRTYVFENENVKVEITVKR